MTFNFLPLTYPSNAIHVSLDLETTSLSSNAGILQIGASAIGDFKVPNFDCPITLLSNEFAKLDISKETMEWWDKQDPELRERVFSGVTPLQTAIDLFIDWCQYLSRDQLDRIVLWCKPSHFDWIILKNATETYREWPFHYRNVGDVRSAAWALLTPATQREVHDQFIRKFTGIQPHNALHDALYQKAYIERVLNVLQILP